ncbi:NADPH2:quinone reductase [Enhydrobacter aerosaccus]|uniref:NADPH2:quinone reductase n=1 Tax=Enhydrobacter aerosaccus TaxID=225324 RepID=A0A1T4R427_9HYPH|nr:zinc-binding dehydrogenase [Enhydrobacter aerosaccus]SKA10418.1 NADPH2:quinone reductase [Enhydrobacter aerosaccus]
MKAVVIHATGGPEQLVVAELPDPVPGPGEVLVDVAYAGCNWADTQVRMGIYPHAMTYPMVLGFEVSGTVAALGPEVHGVAIGERVASFPDKGGAYAEKCVAPAAGLIKLPADVPLDVGAAFPIQALTAYHMLFTVYRLKPGDTVLVNAIGGGVGLMCTQLAVQAGARVIGTTGTPGKEQRALEYGAARVVVTSGEDFETAVLEFTHGKGVDLAIDSYGATMLDRTFNVVRKLGHVISIGEAEGQPFKNIRERILPRSQTFTRLHLGHVDQTSPEWKAGIDHVVSGIEQGWLKVPIEGVFALDRAADMHRCLEGRQVAGKLLLKAGD